MSLLTMATEAISAQINPVFFNEMTQIYADFKQHKKRNTLSVQLEKCIAHHTNLKTDVKIEGGHSWNAYTHIPDIRNNHPLLYDAFRSNTEGEDIRKLFAKTDKTALSAHVDRKRHRVGGVFAKITQHIVIGQGLIDEMEADQIAAVTLHEVGHWFTFFETMADAMLVNYVLTELSQDVVKESEKTLKMDLYLEAASMLDSDVKLVKESLGKDLDDNAMHVILLDNRIHPQQSNSGVSLYDLRATEQLADQFVSRLGGGEALAKGLANLHKEMGDPNYSSKGLFYTMDILITIIASPGLLLLVVPLMLILGTTPMHEIYDPIKERLARIRNDLVTQLRLRTTPKQRKDQLVEEIEAIDKLVKEANNHTGTFTHIWLFFSPSLRNEKRKMEVARDLEDLASNRLFVKAHRFSQLA